MRILLLIRQLSVGGAERQVCLLATALRQRGHEIKVAVFYGGGALEAELAGAGIPLIDLGKRGRWDNAGFVWRLLRTLRCERPDIVYSFLTVANLLNSLLGPCLPGTRRVIGLRASNMDLSRYDGLSRLTSHLETRLAGQADLVIANSERGRQAALAAGFPAARLRVVRNGIDTRRFLPDRRRGAAFRAAWGIAPEQWLVGLIGRLDPMKGHPIFLQAAARLRTTDPGLRFVCVGGGPAALDASLRRQATDLGLDDRLIWAGPQTDMPAVYNALDMAVSASLYGEGMSNTLAEAMACGIPCVTTDVGDAAWLVEDCGIVVPPGDAAALAGGIADLTRRAQQQGDTLGRAVRQHIETRLGEQALAEGTLAAFASLG